MKKSPYLLFLSLAIAWPGLVQANPAETIATILEKEQMRWLNQQQSKPGVIIDEFETDGCSGGMSEMWTYLAELSPAFAAGMGQYPPWESCCVTHDRHYWRGESVNGYEKRQQADRALQQCVLESGRAKADNLAYQLGMTRAETLDLISLTADLMYTAVRVGGRPCTGLPWRWGHGWPECEIPLVDDLPGMIK